MTHRHNGVPWELMIVELVAVMLHFVLNQSNHRFEPRVVEPPAVEKNSRCAVHTK